MAAEPLSFDLPADRAANADLRQFFRASGALGHDLLAVDWAATPLGPLEGWPQSLKTIVQVLLTSRFSMWMAWGPELTFLANETYVRDTLGAKYPWALGKPASAVWEEIWPEIGPRIEAVMTTGIASWDESLRLFLERSGYPEETYHTFSYSPLRDESREIVGMLCVVSEETDRVLGEQRMTILRELGGALTAARTEDEVFAAVAGELEHDLGVLPFSLVYLFDGDRATLACAAGAAPGDTVAPESVELAGAPWPFAEAERGRPVVVGDLAERFTVVPAGRWREPATSALVVPLAGQQDERPYGAFVAGLNRYRSLDQAYEGFVVLLASQIAASIANARAYDAERRRAETLAELDRAKTAFFTNISHEFRTPLTLILAPTEDSLHDPERPLPAVHRERLELVRRNAIRMRRLVNDLLDFSRLETGRLVPEVEETDLRLLTQEVASTFAGAVEGAGLDFVVELAELGRPGYVDREMWEKILLNLLSNALKHTLEGEIRLTLEPDGEHVRLQVQDTGVGIPAEEMKNLFQRFHRVRSSRGRSHEGTGIGLALTKELVLLHGGEVSAESELGVGSTFTVRIPFGHRTAFDRSGALQQDGANGAVSAEPYLVEASRWLEGEAADGHGRRDGTVMVVDDNPEMRRLLVRLLSPHWDVSEFPDGAKALEAARASPPDVVLADVMMPNLDGFGLLRELRREPAAALTAVIFVSARAGEESSVEGFEAGADDYLVKPFSPAELIARVRTHVHRARLQRDEREAREQAELLEQIAVRMTAGPTREQVAQLAVEELARHGIGYAAVLLVDRRDDEEHLELLASAGTEPQESSPAAEAIATDTALVRDGMVAAPLHGTSGEAVGALCVASCDNAWPTPGRRRLVAAIAEQVGSALERARLDEALLARERSALLLSHLTEMLVRLNGASDRAAAAAEILVEDLVDVAMVFLERDGRLELVAGHGDPDPGLSRTAAELAEGTAAAATAKSAALDDGAALLSLPLRVGGQTIGALCVVRRAASLSSRNVTLHLEDVADRTAILIDNALLYERERRISHRLQTGLLGEELPQLGGIELLPVYRPGTVSLEVGGDWYDAFALPAGRVALVVGDVVGHGLEAAISMGQLRGAVRALAPLGGPAELLVRLDEFAETIRGADSATLAYAEFEPATGRLRYACAGHPPPFVLRSDGRAEYLWDGRSTPLATALFGARSEASLLLEPGDTIGLYTDGLVERRGQSLDERFERLLDAVSASAGQPLERLSGFLIGEMLRDEPTDDDVCLLLVRAGIPVFSSTIPADPAELATLRRALRTWLEHAGVEEPDRQAVLLAAGEAVTNAVEHAYAGKRGVVWLDAWLSAPGELRLTIRDQGHWLDRPSREDRGRGLDVMRVLVDELAVSRRPLGTTVELRKRLRGRSE